MTLEPIVDLLCTRIPGLVAVYVFGSAATGDAHSDSDLDLAVLGESRLKSTARWDLQGEAAILAGRAVDLVDLRSASSVMRMQVVSTGRLLFSRNRHEMERFEMYVLSDYCRLNEERRAILDDVAQRGRVYA